MSNNTVIQFPQKQRDKSKARALILGINGEIGHALAKDLQAEYSVVGVAREIHNADHHFTLVQSDYKEKNLSELKNTLSNISESYQLIVNCIGLLHTDDIKPEKRLDDIKADQLNQYFYVNATLPALLIKYLHPLLAKRERSVYANLSAMVGSIGDNRLGGWYGYRASKAALNMLVKTASIELKRTRPNTAMITIHPGTTVSELSAPYSQNTPVDKLYPAQLTALRLANVIESVQPEQTGQFFNWDGSNIEW